MSSASAAGLLGPRFRDALVFAAELHQEQTRKDSDIPYVGHLLIVAGTVIEWGGDEDMAIAAMLHDALEDQSKKEPRPEIERRYGGRVLAMVEGLSDADVEPKPPWLQRKKEYFAHLPHASDHVLKISLADKLHNARAILSDYLGEGDAVWTRFTIKDQGALPQVWYLSRLLEIYESRLEPRFTREFRRVVEDLARHAGLDLSTLPEPRDTEGSR